MKLSKNVCKSNKVSCSTITLIGRCPAICMYRRCLPSYIQYTVSVEMCDNNKAFNLYF